MLICSGTVVPEDGTHPTFAIFIVVPEDESHPTCNVPYHSLCSGCHWQTQVEASLHPMRLGQTFGNHKECHGWMAKRNSASRTRHLLQAVQHTPRWERLGFPLSCVPASRESGTWGGRCLCPQLAARHLFACCDIYSSPAPTARPPSVSIDPGPSTSQNLTRPQESQMAGLVLHKLM